MATARDLVTDALGEIGVVAGSEAATYEDAALALRMLNRMVDQWSAEPLTIFNLQRYVWDITSGTAAYRVGSPAATTYQDVNSDGFDTTWTGTPPGWEVTATGSGDVSNDSATYQAGGHSVLMTTTDNTSTVQITKDYPAVAGVVSTVRVYAQRTLAGDTVQMRVQCVESGHYLTSAGAWQDGVTAAATFTSATFAIGSVSFTMEDQAVVGAVIGTLRITLYMTTTSGIGTSVWFDTFALSQTLTNLLITSVPIPWPSKIEHVHLLNNNVDPGQETELTKLTEDAWTDLAVKDQESTYPSTWFYNLDLPDFEITRDVQGFYGTLTLWPVPTGTGLQGVAYVKTQITRFESLDSGVRLPPGFEEFIVTNLAVRLCEPFGRTAKPSLIDRARDARAIVKRSNHRLVDMSFDAAILFGNRGGYDITQG